MENGISEVQLYGFDVLRICSIFISILLPKRYINILVLVDWGGILFLLPAEKVEVPTKHCLIC